MRTITAMTAEGPAGQGQVEDRNNQCPFLGLEARCMIYGQIDKGLDFHPYWEHTAGGRKLSEDLSKGGPKARGASKREIAGRHSSQRAAPLEFLERGTMKVSNIGRD